MAALYDNSAKGFSVVSGSTLSSGSFAVGGSNRVLYVFVGTGAAGAPVEPATVKWNTSESFTQISTTITSANGKFSVWRLIAPTAATSTVDVTWGSNQDERLVVAISVKDCDQATPNNTVAQAGPTISTAATVTATSVSGDLVIDGCYFLDSAGNSRTLAVNGGQTSRQEIEGADTAFEGLGVSTLTATGTSTVMPWTISGAITVNGWSMFAFATNGASGAAQNQLFYYKA